MNLLLLTSFAVILCLASTSNAQTTTPFETQPATGAATTSTSSARKWQPGYVSATLADAYADSLRMKAASKYASKPAIASVQTTPAAASKSKDFTFTNIRLNTQATGTTDGAEAATQAISDLGQGKLDTLLALLAAKKGAGTTTTLTTGQVAPGVSVSGARQPESPFTTTNVGGGSSSRRLQEMQAVKMDMPWANSWNSWGPMVGEALDDLLVVKLVSGEEKQGNAARKMMN